MTGRLPVLFFVATLTTVVLAAPSAGLSGIGAQELRGWLTYIASDELAGRANFSEGLGLAGDYIEAHLRSWHVEPHGDAGSYAQTVRVLGVKTTSHSTVTVTVAGESRTFADGEGVVFPKNVGGKRRVTIDRVEFAGYGVDAPLAGHRDFAGKSVKGAAVVWLGSAGPKGLDSRTYRRLLAGRNRYAAEQLGAAAAIGVQVPNAFGGQGGGGAQPAPPGGGPGAQAIPRPDFTTVQRLDTPIAPTVTANDTFFEFLFSHAPSPYEELKTKAAAQESLPSFTLKDVTLTFTIDADYQVVRTQLTHNIVGVLEGSDPQLKSTYVAFGAHYDHVGYAEGEVVTGDNGEPRRLGAPGRVKDGAIEDRIWNGADDDGSGTVAVMALAKAFSEGPRPKRSLLFVGTPARSAASGGRDTSRTTRPCRSTPSSRS